MSWSLKTRPATVWTPGFAWAGGSALAAITMALYTQYQLDMQPCPWCVLQRALFAVIALLGAAGWLWRRRMPQQGLALAIALFAAAGLAAALWQHFVAASSTSCVQTLADRLMQASGLSETWPAVFAAYASCADAAVRLLGLPYEFYSAVLFAGLLAGALVLVRSAGTRR